MNTKEKDQSYIMHTYGRYNVALKEGKGVYAYDEDGKKYIDVSSGIGVNSLGYANDGWIKAITEQASKVQHISNYFYSQPASDLAEKLCSKTHFSKVCFGNSGAEANECAIKLARKYSFDKYGKGRDEIITLENSFHGRTVTTLSATGQDVFHNFFFPFTEGFKYVPANDIDALKNTATDKTCAVLMECVQGEGGVNILNKEYVQAVKAFCDEKDILLIVDEVQTGIGRTGKLLASQHYGKMPDVTTLAKGLAGGVPIGACLANEKCCDVLSKGTHGSTFGGNPIACAGGNVVIDKVTADGFLDEVMKKSEYLKTKLSELSEVEGVDGLGLMLGVRLKTKSAADICKACLDNGMLALTAKTKLRFLPPLTITFDEIDKGLDILRKVLE